MAKEHLVSIIIPVYNAENFIKQTLDSVINQTYKNLEIICVNDCSTDKSLEILNEYAKKDSRIKVLSNEVNSKVSKTRNHGVLHASAEWIALLDSDDYWEKDFIEKAVALKNKMNAEIVSTSYKFVTHEGEAIEKIYVVPEKYTYKDMLKQNRISCSAVLIKKQLLIDNPFYADAVHEDYLCWLTIMKKVGVGYGVQDPVSVYRLTKNSKSRNKIKAIKMSYKTYKMHGLNFFKRCYYTFCNAINGLKKYHKVSK